MTLERGQKLYVANAPDTIFEGSLLELDIAARAAKLDPIAELTLDPQTKAWNRRPLPKGPARVEPLAAVHDEENEARHYARYKYASPLGDVPAWCQQSKRIWAAAATPAETGKPVETKGPRWWIADFVKQKSRRPAADTDATTPAKVGSGEG
jgi:hypothetical protein